MNTLSEAVKYALNDLILQNKPTAGLFFKVRRPRTGAVGKSAPTDGDYLPCLPTGRRQTYGTNTLAVGSRIQVC